MPSPGTGDWRRRTGTSDDVVDPAVAAAAKAMPLSVSTVAPAAFRTEKVVELLDRPAPAAGVVSRMAATAAPSHAYMTLSSEIELCGNSDGPRDGAASARYTGPAITSAYVCPPRSSRPFPLPSSPASRRRLPLASSFGPVIVIEPGVAPPSPLLTVTRQVPTKIGESAALVSLFGSKLRWMPSCGFRLSWISACPTTLTLDHWSLKGLSVSVPEAQTAPSGRMSPANRQLSGPGPSRTRSRSFTSGPPLPGAEGGSIQAIATRNCPRPAARPAPAVPTVTGQATRKVCDWEVCVLSMVGSAVAMSSQTKRPCAGFSQCAGPGGVLPAIQRLPVLPTPPRRKLSDQFGRGRTFVRTTRPYPCSLFPMIPIGMPLMVPTSKERVRRRVLSDSDLSVSPGVRTFVVNLAEATRAAFTSAPETFETRLAVRRSPLGYRPC